jgi:hypothetical protein
MENKQNVSVEKEEYAQPKVTETANLKEVTKETYTGQANLSSLTHQ